MRTTERQAQTHDAAVWALLEYDGPYIAFGVARYGIVTDEGPSGAHCTVIDRAGMLEVLRKYGRCHGSDGETCADIALRIEEHRGLIPHLIQWEAGTALEFITAGEEPAGSC